MARGNLIKVLRTTRANLESARAASQLFEGEPYLITDEGRIAYATAVNAYKIIPNITVSASDPSGGVDGDIWFKEDPLTEDVQRLFKMLDADSAGTNGTGAQPWFPVAGGVTVEAGTYEFEGLLHNGHGTTAHTTAVLFAGTATVSWIEYLSQVHIGNVNGLATSQFSKWSSSAAANILNNSAGAASTVVWISGAVRFSAGGTFIPQYQMSVAPGATVLSKRGTKFGLRKLGDSSFVSNGTWA